jgi:hypothetical protein
MSNARHRSVAANYEAGGIIGRETFQGTQGMQSHSCHLLLLRGKLALEFAVFLRTSASLARPRATVMEAVSSDH